MNEKENIPTYQVTLEVPRDVYNFIESTTNLYPGDITLNYLLHEILLEGIKEKHKFVSQNDSGKFYKKVVDGIGKQIKEFLLELEIFEDEKISEITK